MNSYEEKTRGRKERNKLKERSKRDNWVKRMEEKKARNSI